jgi:hypothetical protein
MVQIGSETEVISDRANRAQVLSDAYFSAKPEPKHHAAPGLGADVPRDPPLTRRTPRVSLIVVLPESHVICPDRLVERLREHGDQDVDVVVACAGQPTNLSALQRSVGDAQFLLAPAGTSTEDLRELAMRQVGGDIITLLSGALLPAATAEAPLVMTS